MVFIDIALMPGKALLPVLFILFTPLLLQVCRHVDAPVSKEQLC